MWGRILEANINFFLGLFCMEKETIKNYAKHRILLLVCYFFSPGRKKPPKKKKYLAAVRPEAPLSQSKGEVEGQARATFCVSPDYGSVIHLERSDGMTDQTHNNGSDGWCPFAIQKRVPKHKYWAGNKGRDA